jgi:hypothetical protein
LVAFDSLTRGPRQFGSAGATLQSQRPSLFSYKRGADPLLAKR